jgi:hypothetical protein
MMNLPGTLMNTVVNPQSVNLQALLMALAAECAQIDPLQAGKGIPPTDELIEALDVLSAWVPSFGIVLREARHQ